MWIIKDYKIWNFGEINLWILSICEYVNILKYLILFKLYFYVLAIL